MKTRDFVLLVLLALGLVVGHMIIGNRPDCICSTLTRQEERYPITSALNVILDINSAGEGTFIRIITTCEHGERIHATIFPDEGYFTGYKE